MGPIRFAARTTARLAAGAGAAGAGLTAYAAWEARQYTVRRVEMPVLPAGARPVRVLHLSDIHMMPAQRRKQEWLAGLAALEPDLVVDTGDNIAHASSVPIVRECLGALLDVPGVFVFGSNDYFSPVPKNPLRYLMPDDGRRNTHVRQLPWRDLRDDLVGAGWLDLTNRRATLRLGELGFAFAGVDDPHLGYDRLADVAGAVGQQAAEAADVRLAVAHAPYLRVLDQFAADGYDAIFAGHTHGGQVCVPGYGALTTNCDLDAARVKGLSRHPATSRDGDQGSAWLHVSAGLGTSPYTRIRIACRPETTLLTLVPRRSGTDWGAPRPPR